MSEYTELAPCPFCGGEVTAWQSEGFGIVRVIECRECQTRFIFPWNQAETGYDLLQKWNRRADK